MTTPDLVSPVAPRSSRRVERFNTIVVGGGQAGLSAGYHLQQRDVDFVIVDAQQRVGDVWRNRWDTLRLFTPAKYSGLPGMPFPAQPMHLPDKDEVADYLERYAERFDLPIRSDTHAQSLVSDSERWVLRTNNGTLEADNVVVATGPFQRPHIPDVAQRLSPDIHQIHSSAYRSPFDLADGPVLVAGAGNSGAQIAVELARHRTVWLAGRDPGHLPRRVLGRDLFAWLWPVTHRFTLDTRLGRWMRRAAGEGGDALIGIPKHVLTDGGVVRVGRVGSVRDGWPVCDDTVLRPRTVVWCTGFESDYRWIDAAVFDERGVPRHQRGVVAEAPGLYFLGLRFQHRMTSSLVGGVKHDAEFVASEIVDRIEAAMAE